MKHQHIKAKRTDGAAQYGGNTASLASFPNRPGHLLPREIISISKFEYIKLRPTHHLTAAPTPGEH